MGAIVATSRGSHESQDRSITPETTTIELASRRLGIGRSLGYQLAREGRFPVRVIRAGRRLLVSTAALDRLLQGAPNHEVRPEDIEAVAQDAPAA
jgi:hypothetical protein